MADAGWFPDPQDPTQLRFWDGQAWTDHRQPAAPAAPTSPYGSDPFASAPYAGTPAPGSPYAAAPADPGNTLSIIGIVCGAIALLFCPPGFGIAGLVLGGIAKSKGERLATWALVVSAIGLVGGIAIGIALYANGIGFGA